MRLKNKITLITGAARGIGASTAKLFAEEGALVIATDILDEVGNNFASQLGDNACYRHLDVREIEDWKSVCEFIKQKHGHLDVLVNNAGITGLTNATVAHDPENVTLEAWCEVHTVNLGGVFLGCKLAIPLMKDQGGSIINISSRSGNVGIPRATAYASSKAAVRNHTKSVALYCTEEKYPIRCNSIHPAAILTPMWDDMLGQGAEREKAIEQIGSTIPMGKMGEPLDVAYAALYLASDESKYVTGSELHIDGGLLAGSAASPKAKGSK